MFPVIPERDIAVEYLGMSPNTALKKAREQAQPLPTFRLGDSEKADRVVSIHHRSRVS
ncbi:pyocin activator PrtN family protein [Agarivorans sp. TSD2052]|uniref:pyocin activator PrtN family protein n=1 Tax=Agarivorans sp. TSD2052 TaxID=2937286 RepID=UPI003531E57D